MKFEKICLSYEIIWNHMKSYYFTPSSSRHIWFILKKSFIKALERSRGETCLSYEIILNHIIPFILS